MTKKIKNFRHSYTELSKVGRKYYSDKAFCSVIALAVGCDLSFGTALSISRKSGRDHRRGANIYGIFRAFALAGKRLEKIPVDSHGKTLTTAERNAPKTGRYIYFVRGHVACIRDGVLEDWTAGGSRRRIEEAYKVCDT
mgnify:CR=1 FL=1|tara:strand:+ start:106 stop:522 length:417 start_codon:yes stop_codon:yes gene_type:complete